MSAAGLAPLVALGVRRDRAMIASWFCAMGLAVVGTAISYLSLYPSVADRESFAAGVEATGATRALYGRIYAAESIGGLVSWRLLGLGGMLVAVFVVLLVVRHSRADEQAGRVELVAAGAVDRAAPLAAATGIALGSLFALCLLCAIGLVAVGESVEGSFAFGAAWLGLGAVMIGVATIAVQLSANARAARGIALGAAAALFALRMIGDATSASWLSWCSPFGWAQQLRPFDANRWWVLMLPAVASAGLCSVGFALHSRRDLGAGLLAQRAGPPRAGRLLRGGAFGLTWRLGRAALTGWTVGFALYGLVIGSVASSVGDFTDGNQTTEDVIAKLGGAGSLVDSFIGAGVSICAMVAGAYVVSTVLRALDDESSGLQETALATRVSRVRWLGALWGLALLGTLAIMAAAGLVSGLLRGAHTQDGASEAAAVLAGALAAVPGPLLVGSGCLLAFGWAPRCATAVGWSLAGGLGAISLIGPLVNAPQFVMDVSPFTHLPTTPHADFPVQAFLGIAALTLIVTLCAFAGFRRRDLRVG